MYSVELIVLFIFAAAAMYFSVKENGRKPCDYHEWSNEIPSNVLVCLKCNTRNL